MVVDPGKARLSQERRLQAIWKMAVDSVGCEAGPAVEFEAKVMVEGLKQIRESIRQIEEKIQEICSQFPEYECLLSIPGFGPDVSSKVLGGDWGSVSVSEWETGFEVGRFGSQCGAQREELRRARFR